MRALLITAALAALLGCGGHKAPAADPLASCAKSGLCGDGPLYGITTMAFVTSDGMGHSQGFHLAGADTGACPASGFTDPVTQTVVDNQFANIIPALEAQIGSALPTLVQNAINGGGLSLLFEIVGDPTQDKTVDVVIHHGQGAPLLGADGLLLADQTLALAPDAPLGICKGAVVSSGQVSCGPFDVTVPVTVFAKTYNVQFVDTYLKMTLPTDGSDAQLLMGGGITIENIQAVATEAGPEAGNLTPIVMTVVPDLADVPDPTTQRCDRISGALQLSARSVFAITQ